MKKNIIIIKEVGEKKEKVNEKENEKKKKGKRKKKERSKRKRKRKKNWKKNVNKTKTKKENEKDKEKEKGKGKKKEIKAKTKTKIGPQSEDTVSESRTSGYSLFRESCPYLHLVPEPAFVLVHHLLHAYGSAYAFMFIATRFCLPFLPDCCKCDIITVDDRLLRKRPNETVYLANRPQKPYQKIRVF